MRHQKAIRIFDRYPTFQDRALDSVTLLTGVPYNVMRRKNWIFNAGYQMYQTLMKAWLGRVNA